MLNNIIRHLNAGRRANAENEIPEFAEATIPSDLELSKQKKSVIDYMDNDIKEHWNFYITQKLQSYMDKRYKVEKENNDDE